MAATIHTASRASHPFPVFQGAGDNVSAAHGTYMITDAVEVGEVYEMCRLPKNANVVSGWVYAEQLDTHASPLLDMDVGWAANGVDAADPAGFGNLGVWVGDPVPNNKPETWNRFPFGGVLMQGPKMFNAETMIQITVNVAAREGGVGALSIVVFYTNH